MIMIDMGGTQNPSKYDNEYLLEKKIHTYVYTRECSRLIEYHKGVHIGQIKQLPSILHKLFN